MKVPKWYYWVICAVAAITLVVNMILVQLELDLAAAMVCFVACAVIGVLLLKVEMPIRKKRREQGLPNAQASLLWLAIVGALITTASILLQLSGVLNDEAGTGLLNIGATLLVGAIAAKFLRSYLNQMQSKKQ